MQERLLALPDARSFVLRSYPRLTVEEGHVAFQPNSWASPWVTRGPYPTHKPPTWLFCRYFYSRFHPHTSYNSTGCAIYSTCGRFCFHHGQNRKLHVLPPPSAIKNDVIMRSWSLFTTSMDGNLRGFVPAFSRVLHPSTEAKIYAVVRSLSLYKVFGTEPWRCCWCMQEKEGMFKQKKLWKSKLHHDVRVSSHNFKFF